jgi:hypothetical protein
LTVETQISRVRFSDFFLIINQYSTKCNISIASSESIVAHAVSMALVHNAGKLKFGAEKKEEKRKKRF